MKNKILPITLIIGLLLSSIGIVINRIDLRELQGRLESTKEELTAAVETITSTKAKLDSTSRELV